jgi:hypothetical protein
MTTVDDERWAPLGAVLDTCFFASGQFDAGKIEGLAARLGSRGVALWIPRQVIYEWSAHAWDALQSLKRAQKRLSGVGITVDPAPDISAADIASRIHVRCEAMKNVEVLGMGGPAAVEAIRDQILGQGAGGVTNGVRTGAVDASVYRDGLCRAGGEPQKVVFLTANVQDFRRAATALGHDEIHWATSTQYLFDTLLPAGNPRTSKSDARALIVARFLCDMRDTAQPEPEWIAVSDLRIDEVGARDRRDLEELVEPIIEMAQTGPLVEVCDVEVEVDGDSEVVSYTVNLLAHIGVEGLTFRDDNTWNTSLNLYDMLVAAPFAAKLHDGDLGPAYQTDAARAQEAGQQFRDHHDAYEWVTDTIDAWDDILFEAPDEEASGSRLAFTLIGPNGRQVAAAVLEGSIGNDWTLQFTNDKLWVQISARYDPDSRAWLGRQDSFDRYPPVGLRSDINSGYHPEPYTALGLVWQGLVAPV